MVTTTLSTMYLSLPTNNSSAVSILPHTTPMPKPVLEDWEKVLYTIGLSLLSIITLFGNTLVALAFYTYRPLRCLTNYFIVSLAMADILVAVISMPVWIVFVMLNMDFTVYGGKLVIAWTCFDIMFGVASILNLTAVSVDRYIHITKPMTHQKLITKRRVTIVIGCIWIFSCGISLIKGLHWKWEKPNYEMLIFCCGFVLPVIVIVYCYVNIYAAVQQQLKKFRENTLMLNKPNPLKKDMKAIKTIALVVLAFLLCWCPFFILNVIHGWCNCKINQHVITFAKWLHYTNSALNPIIYACFNKDYRRGFKNALYKYTSSSPEQSALSTMISRNSVNRDSFVSEYRRSVHNSFNSGRTPSPRSSNGFDPTRFHMIEKKDSMVINGSNATVIKIVK